MLQIDTCIEGVGIRFVDLATLDTVVVGTLQTLLPLQSRAGFEVSLLCQ